MPIAPSFQTMKILDEPYLVGNKMYVRIENPKTGTIRQVRWYTDREFQQQWPQAALPEAEVSASSTILRPLKEVLGFDKGYITIFKGDTSRDQDWFDRSVARWHEYWGWYIISTDPVPSELPFGIEARQLTWDAIALNDNTLRCESEVRTAVESLMYEESPSKWMGEVGDRLNLDLTVTSTRSIDTAYGSSIIHNMVDPEGNVFVWITSAKNWPVGAHKKLRGTVKEHKSFRGTKQTILTRCSEVVGC